MITDDGQKLGEVFDILIDDKTGEIRGYYVGTGKVVSMTQGLRWVPVENTVRMGYRILYVPASVAQDFENQVGGIQGALDQVGDRVRTAGSRANRRLEEAGGKVQQAGGDFNTRLGQYGDQLRQNSAIDRRQHNHGPDRARDSHLVRGNRHRRSRRHDNARAR